ncbi:type III pantothenate kinase [Cyanobium sp. LEGE 06143]|uniref:type III pantothenate kinase n=1 Tax=Cyanobium sp. LEGE 06143 TaxID=945727 RepID=UPI001882106B|nr:type III pantothenate kinase [Cyanobium sp. LEGE 06143]
MRASDPAEEAPGLWLLIGNSRWHWARGSLDQWRCWSVAPGAEAGPGHAPTAWAAVGPVAAQPALDPTTRLGLKQVPLVAAPPWLGVDRALVGWQAWQQSAGPVLVADAGTALSLTRVGGDGRFAGGRILAGAALQWRALAAATAQLPTLPASCGQLPADPWPHDTAEAIRSGVLRGLAAAVELAWREACQLSPGCSLWITGGDGAELAALLGRDAEPDLALRALARLRPAPGR